LSIFKTIVIVGPTGIGKSNLSVLLARKINGEVIGLDSRQVFDFMPIGTGQPNQKEMFGVMHHLVGTHKILKNISAGEYSKLVHKSIKKILKKKKLPIICGGSGLYFRALVNGLFKGSITNLEIRKKLLKRLNSEGSNVLLDKLKLVDPIYARIVHPNNIKRLLRALEIYYITGLGPSEHFKKQEINQENDIFFKIYLKMDLQLLKLKINKRILEMIKNGWIEEVKQISVMAYKNTNQAMESICYKEILQYLDKKISYNELINQININTRQYAKKQIKWFEKEKFDLIIDINNLTENLIIKKIINTFYATN